MGEHRVSMLSASLRRFEDPARSSDPRIRTLVARLAALEPAPAPRAHFRAELRAQLVAVAPRLVAEGPTIEARRPTETATVVLPAAKPAKSSLASAVGWTSRISIARPLAVVTAVIAVFAMLLGGATWISKKALPGDALYSLKRANENVALSLAPDDAAKGREYLKLARTRAEEVWDLVSLTSSIAVGPGANAASGVNPHTAKLMTTTLDSADSDTRNAAKLLDVEAVRSGSSEPLKSMISWARGQLDVLQGIADRLGSGALHDRVAASSKLTAAASTRATALHADLSCHCLDRVATDEFGPMPCLAACPALPGPAQQPTAPAKTTPQPAPGGSTATVPGSGPTAPAASTTVTVSVPDVPTATTTVTVDVPTVPSVPITSQDEETSPTPIPVTPITPPDQPTPTADAASPTDACATYELSTCGS
jgi:Domain of unknown function (DUF5667)